MVLRNSGDKFNGEDKYQNLNGSSALACGEPPLEVSMNQYRELVRIHLSYRQKDVMAGDRETYRDERRDIMEVRLNCL